MQLKLKAKEFLITDVDKIIAALSNLDPKNIEIETIYELLKIFEATDNYILIDKLALFLSDTGRAIILEPLIRKLNKIKQSNHTSTLIYVCSEYDCSEYILFFIDLLISNDYHTMIEAMSVLESIKNPIKLADKIIAHKKLTDALIGLNEAEENYTYINDALELIDSLNSQ